MLLKEKKRFDYYAFGMEMPGRSIGSDFAYNFNGKRTDKWNGDNGSYLDFGARIHDARLGRFFNPDPAKSGWSFEAPYIFAGNTPIQAIDENGEKIYFVNKDGTVLDLSVASNISKIDDKSFKMAYVTLMRTTSGKRLLNYYNSTVSNHDIYMKKSYVHSVSNELASTRYAINLNQPELIEEGKINTQGYSNEYLSSFRALVTFNGLDVSNSLQRNIDIIEFNYLRFNIGLNYAHYADPANPDLLIPSSFYTFKKDEYELAETIYHEIFAHILLGAIDVSYNKSTTTSKPKEDHRKYGSSSSNPITYFKSPINPYQRINSELFNLKAKDVINFKNQLNKAKNGNSNIKNGGSSKQSKSKTMYRAKF